MIIIWLILHTLYIHSHANELVIKIFNYDSNTGKLFDLSGYGSGLDSCSNLCDGVGNDYALKDALKFLNVLKDNIIVNITIPYAEIESLAALIKLKNIIITVQNSILK